MGSKNKVCSLQTCPCAYPKPLSSSLLASLVGTENTLFLEPIMRGAEDDGGKRGTFEDDRGKKPKTKSAKKMISFMKGLTRLMEQMEDLQDEGEDTDEDSGTLDPLYTGMAKMMQ